jgi:hypothetical protein
MEPVDIVCNRASEALRRVGEALAKFAVQIEINPDEAIANDLPQVSRSVQTLRASMDQIAGIPVAGWSWMPEGLRHLYEAWILEGAIMSSYLQLFEGLSERLAPPARLEIESVKSLKKATEPLGENLFAISIEMREFAPGAGQAEISPKRGRQLELMAESMVEFDRAVVALVGLVEYSLARSRAVGVHADGR